MPTLYLSSLRSCNAFSYSSLRNRPASVFGNDLRLLNSFVLALFALSLALLILAFCSLFKVSTSLRLSDLVMRILAVADLMRASHLKKTLNNQ